MGRAAVFFDLDRTLLLTASGRVLNEALQSVGAVPGRALPGQGLIYRSYDLLGESLPGMALARAAAFAVRGRRRELLLAAGEQAADRLERLVAPWAPGVMDEHRRAGRVIVLATTTPYDLIEPLARRLGLDDVIATRYGTTGEGAQARYTGRLEGPFVWSTGKLAAVRQWAARPGIDLAECWAYSDSFYDLPLLSAVGHPVAVNADPRLALIAGLRRWQRIHLDAPPGVPEFLGIEPMEAIRRVVRPEMFPYARFDIAGTQHIPRTGPALVVANHRSYFDVPTIGLTVMKAGRIPRGLAKKELFDAPVVGQLARAFGQIMVDRKGSPTEVMAAVITALRAGEVIVLTPEGTIPRGAAFYRTKLKGKTGAARLAAATRVPVIPVGIWGTEKVWPRSARLPNMTNILHPPLVQVRVGPPVEGLRYGAAKADTATIMDAIVALLPEEASREREPTEDEIALATPPGGKGA